MTPAISVVNLSKMYRLGGGGDTAEYRTLRESVMGWVGKPINRLRNRGAAGAGAQPAAAPSQTELWALKDVSFDVAPGEVIGLIGRNGAGKSTLLKILSRITHPTGGHIAIRGRVGSLLEVGTGFHPELTGRENIFLNGAILGMTRREIARKFDEIVAFSELERFLDTPVKRYSSGMYTRLAFAVASHLEPEVLVVDEVLAVGDAAFQKKCLGRMNEVSKEGRTVLFVSHNMSAVKSLCTRGVVIESGRVAYDGNIDDAVNRYLTAGSDGARTGVIPDDAHRMSDVKDEARLRVVRLTDLDGHNVSQVYFGQKFRVGIECEVFKDIEDGHFEISVSTLDGTHVTYTTTIDGGIPPIRIAKGRHQVRATFDTVLLPRQYTIDVGIHHHNGITCDFCPRTLDFTVLRVAEAGDDHYRWPRTRGLVRAVAAWDVSASVSSDA